MYWQTNSTKAGMFELQISKSVCFTQVCRFQPLLAFKTRLLAFIDENNPASVWSYLSKMDNFMAQYKWRWFKECRSPAFSGSMTKFKYAPENYTVA